jgi:TPP-dependent pyruvate/acetoin dehydrogenase alpha subunit
MTVETTTKATTELYELYRQMLRIRRTEERVLELLLQSRLSSTMCHVSIGQEAVAAGVCAALEPGDYITSTHRGHGHFLARGGSMRAFFAELMGRQAGVCAGRGGSMHLVDPAIGHLGSNAIVGGHIPIATGAALWSQITGDGRVTASFFGDGATTEGIFHEAVNFAALWKLPIVFVVENNQYAMSLPWPRSTAEPSMTKKAAGYGLAGMDVDGQDVDAVRLAADEAVRRARRGEGPTLMGVLTYRFLGHSRGDPSAYRDHAEEERWKAREPLALARALLEQQGTDAATFAELDTAVLAEIEDAVSSAEASPPASLDTIFDDVFATTKGAGL